MMQMISTRNAIQIRRICGMNRKDWLSLFAVHSDCWLLSVGFSSSTRFNCNERKRLFSMMNNLPTVFEVITGRKPAKDKSTVESGSKSRNSTKRSTNGQPRSNPKLAAKVTRRLKKRSMKKSRVMIPFVGAVGEDKTRMSFGSVATTVKGGIMESV